MIALIPFLVLAFVMEFSQAVAIQDWHRQCRGEEMTYFDALTYSPNADGRASGIHRKACPDGTRFDWRASIGSKVHFVSQILIAQWAVVFLAWHWLWRVQPRLLKRLA